ncbi:MAG: hypothetical protein ACYTFW_14375 [Planctomycetota bacterium]
MKSLILTIIIVILAMPLTGCTVVTGHRHGHTHHGVVITHPRHRPIPPPPPPHPGSHHQRGRPGRPFGRHMLP